MPDETDSWIGDLASKDAQLRYIINATADEYLLPDEMLDMALSESAVMLRRDDLNPSQTEALTRLIEAIRNSGDFLNQYDRANIADLIERDPVWSSLRERAQVVLGEFGGNFSYPQHSN